MYYFIFSGGDRKTNYETPQQSTEGKPVPSATVERQKSQISRMQAETDKVIQHIVQKNQDKCLKLCHCPGQLFVLEETRPRA